MESLEEHFNFHWTFFVRKNVIDVDFQWICGRSLPNGSSTDLRFFPESYRIQSKKQMNFTNESNCRPWHFRKSKKSTIILTFQCNVSDRNANKKINEKYLYISSGLYILLLSITEWLVPTKVYTGFKRGSKGRNFLCF